MPFPIMSGRGSSAFAQALQRPSFRGAPPGNGLRNPCYFVPMDVVDLRNFYAQQLGVVARRFVGRGIRARWQDTRDLRVLGVGYATPYLGLFREEAEALFSR